MPKHIVTAIGLIISLGVIALGVFLVALPTYFQAVGVDAQTETVAGTNAVYQAQVGYLREQEERLDEINANVAGMRKQIPARPQLDDVFEVVARAAEASGIALTAVTAGDPVPFATRTGAGDEAEPGAQTDASAADGAESADALADAATADGATADAATAGDPASGRTQVDFAISAKALDMGQVTAFLDALRAGPRLLNSIDVTTSTSSEGTIDVQVSALTYLDTEG